MDCRFEIASAFEGDYFRNMPKASTSAKSYKSEVRARCPKLGHNGTQLHVCCILGNFKNFQYIHRNISEK